MSSEYGVDLSGLKLEVTLTEDEKRALWVNRAYAHIFI